MSQVARLYGQSPALIYVGLRLLDMGYEVKISTTKQDLEAPALRPLRLRAPVVSLIKEAFRREARPYFFLEDAPILSSWAEVGKGALSGLFDRSSQMDRWVDSKVLVDEFFALFKQRGGQVEETPIAALPTARGGVALELMDLDPSELSPEARSAYYPHAERRPSLRLSELWLPHVDAKDEEPDYEFTRFEATLAFSETHPSQGKIFTLYSSSEYSLQRALRALKEPRGVAPTAWKAQVLSEKAPYERRSVAKWGYAGFYRPGVWCLGTSVGKLNPVLNLDASDSLLQGERFIETLRSLPRGQSLILAAEDWRRSEKDRFLASYKRARFMEKFFFSEGAMVDWFQKTSSFLPPSLRHHLKAPI